MLRRILNIILSILGLLSEGHGLFHKLKKNPRDTESINALNDLYQHNPVTFIKALLAAIRTLKEGKNETRPYQPDDWDIFRQTWENTIHKERVQPLQYLTPTSKEELIRIVKDAEINGHMVRAVGKGHSFSDVANATDILVDTLGLKKELPLETDTLKGSHPEIYNTESGVLVQDINQALDAKGLALPTMAAFDQETLYGAIATSTHGTGIRVPGMSHMVKSLDLIAGGGKCYRLEPANGITDKVKFNEKYKSHEIELIQDDDRFYSVVVGFGLMGIVYSLVIEPVQTFYLKQRLWITSWREVKPKLEDRSFFEEIDPAGNKIEQKSDGQFPPTRAQVFVNPYKTKKHWDDELDHTCVVQVQTEITKSEFDKLNSELPDGEIQKIENFVEAFISNGTHGIHKSNIKGEDKESKVEEIGVDLLLAFFNTFPEMTPLILDVSLTVLLSGSGKFGKSYVVMNQGKLAVKNAGYSVEPGFSVDETNNFLKGAEEILRVAGLSQDSHSYLSSPICLRFVKSSMDYLSPEYNVDTCMIDVPSVLGTIGDDQMMDRMQLDLIEQGARPHWGKICNLVNGMGLIGKMYPKFDQFIQSIQFFDPNETFSGTFSYRTGITSMAYGRN